MRLILFVGIAVIAVVVIAVLAYSLTSGLSSTSAITQNKSANSTTIYMSPTQAGLLLNSSLTDYSTSDLFNPASTVNVSLLESFVPQLAGNATSGWVTMAIGTSTSNASLEYIAITTSNTASIAYLLGSSIASSVSADMATAAINSGTYNGLAYTYDAYQNSTATFQTVYGWKNDNVGLTIVQENAGFFANETALVDATANDTP